MRTSTLGLAFIARREGLVTVPYQDGKHLSVGFGHNGPDVEKDETITVDEAFSLLASDIAVREWTVNRVVKRKLAQWKYDAIVSLYYNAGSGPLLAIAELVNKLAIADAAERFPRYCRVRADDPATDEIEYVESAGLKKRRLAEQAMFLLADYGDLSWIPYWPGDPYKTPMQKMPLPAAWGGQ